MVSCDVKLSYSVLTLHGRQSIVAMMVMLFAGRHISPHGVWQVHPNQAVWMPNCESTTMLIPCTLRAALAGILPFGSCQGSGLPHLHAGGS